MDGLTRWEKLYNVLRKSIILGYICLLHREEKGKSLLKKRNTLNQRLLTVSRKEKSQCIRDVYIGDQSTNILKPSVFHLQEVVV